MGAATETPKGATTTNGTKPEDSFPVDSFKEAASHLRRPFTAKAVKFKVQVVAGDRGMIVCYIDARLVVERLNLVCPHLWFDEYEPIDGRMLCRLTVDGITRIDVGEGYQGKGLYSDALKRAGVKFGIGVSLYATKQMWLSKGAQLEERGSGQKRTLVLTEKGIAHCREQYRSWLEAEGIPAFGDPLDHGDAEDSVGDVEAEQSAAAPEGSDEGTTIGKTIARQLVDRVWKLPEAKSSLQLAASHAAGGRDVGDCSTKQKAIEAIAALGYEPAQKLDRWIAKKEVDVDGE